MMGHQVCVEQLRLTSASAVCVCAGAVRCFSFRHTVCVSACDVCDETLLVLVAAVFDFLT
jgi:hypothetical protein